MKLKLYAVKDQATDMYGNPMYLMSTGQAVRSFADEIANKDAQNLLNKHPEHYDLYELGTFDTDTGLFDTHQPERVARGEDYKALT